MELDEREGQKIKLINNILLSIGFAPLLFPFCSRFAQLRCKYNPNFIVGIIQKGGKLVVRKKRREYKELLIMDGT